MVPVDGSLARALQFDDTSIARVAPRLAARRAGLLRGPDKYKVLERRLRAAQIKARHVLDSLDLIEEGQ
ncbi:MAG: hypothetical protein JF613_09535 [Acidobacteria bacterium]|nr:hypothetical protein [Acidobacteriota bacterium]